MRWVTTEEAGPVTFYQDYQDSKGFSMHNRSRQAPELKALLVHLQSKMSPAKRLRDQAAAVATEIITQVQRRSRLRK
jgi:hypothetical protein